MAVDKQHKENGGPGWLAAGAALGAAAVVGNRLWRRGRMFPVEGKTVLISGGARGLGLLLAREFGRLGARVAICSRTAEEIEDAVAHLEELGVPAMGVRCDITDAAQVRDLVSAVVQHTGRLDVLVNNAGVISTTPFEHAQIEDFETSLATHLWGPLYLINAALPHLRETRGRILNISSIGGRIGVPHLVPYSVGKFALVGLSEGLRAELAKDGVVVTTATPGLMRTGSHVRVQLRGRHEREALMFGAGVATSLTSKHATRAARQIVRACREGRAHTTPGVQARLAEMMNIIAPELTAALASSVTTHLLPRPTDPVKGDRPRDTHEVGFGWMTPFLPNDASWRNNELPLRG